MAKKVTKFASWATLSGPVLSGQEANLVQGVFAGMDTSGYIKPGDYRASAGPIVALGFVIDDVQQKDPRGNTLFSKSQVALAKEGKIAGFSGLTIGKRYFLSSGGGITATAPASATGDVDQSVGVAVSATELEVLVAGPGTPHA